MTQKSDDTGRSGTLPAPELNPLLNPILNKNLGKWAEVYFTNPPEKREEAVIHLLRELESGAGAARAVARPPQKARDSAISSKHKAVICFQCGFENEPLQKFCGDCGAPLSGIGMGATAILSQPTRAREYDRAKPDIRPRSGETPGAAPQFGSILHLSDPAPQALFTDDGGDAPPAAESSELFFREPAEAAPLKANHRVSIALTLAIIIGGLGFMAWRAGQSSAEGSRLPAQAPPAATTQLPGAPAVAAGASPTATRSFGPATPANSEVKPIAPPVRPDEKPEKPQNASNKDSLPALQPPATSNGSSAPLPNGGQELATAMTFLNGVGEQRDSAAAAQWLWKAVEKQNTAATVLLAGLYLRGDGVQKNCDQGRVLLDAAADKGNKDAANLLRNLQTFGCQ